MLSQFLKSKLFQAVWDREAVPFGQKFGGPLQFVAGSAHVRVRQNTLKLTLGLAVATGLAWCQNAPASLTTLNSLFTVCNSGANTIAQSEMTLAQQGCWYANDLTAPSLLVRAAFGSAIGHLVNDTSGGNQDASAYAHRLGVYYARHGARDAAELVAGYFNHEDPRPHLSGETGVWRRTKAALWSVVIAQTDEGNRLALTPIAGALGSAFVGTALSRDRAFTGRTILREASVSYSGSFATAVYREFKPDLSSLVRRALHKPTN